MKKLSYLLGVLLVAGTLFSSCSKDDDDGEVKDLNPTITFKTGEGYTFSDVTVNENEEFMVGVVCTSNANSNSKLEEFKLYIIYNNETHSLVDSTDLNAKTFEVSYVLSFDAAFSGILYAEIVDKDGKSNKVSFNLTVVPATTPLSDPQDLTWQRVGGQPATGLDDFGLEWTSNGKLVSAQIKKKADGGAEKFVHLEPANWDITTAEELMALIEAGTDMDVYDGISADATADYDEVLGVRYNDKCYIIHITHAAVETGTQGTTITITGQYKD